MNTKTLKSTLNLFQNIIKQDKLNIMSDLIEIYIDENRMIHFGMTNKVTTVVYKNVLNDEKDIIMDNVVVQLSRLNSIVKLLDSESTYLYNKNDYIMIVSDRGKYKVETVVDEDGNKFHLPLNMPTNDNKNEFFIDNAKEIVDRASTSILDKNSLHYEFLRYACVKDKTVTTDIKTISIVDATLPFDELDVDIVKHISMLPREKVYISMVEDGFRISSENIEIYEKTTTNKNLFPTDIILPFLGYKQFPHFSIMKKDFLNALKRSDFVRSIVDYPKVILTLSPDCVRLESTTGKTKEELNTTDIATDNTYTSLLLLDSVMKYTKLLDTGIINVYINSGKYIVLEDLVGCYVISEVERE